MRCLAMLCAIVLAAGMVSSAAVPSPLPSPGVAGEAERGPGRAASAPVTQVAISTTQPADRGPDVVVLRELEALYDAVPFDHMGHAKMAEMWGGCTTCHHRTPIVTPAQAEKVKVVVRTQAETEKVPACKSCHKIGDEKDDIRMPNLKGAYHRQCLNCHKEWMGENACVICHKAREKAQTRPAVPSPGDITGRMHPPIQEPDVRTYTTRFTPAVGKHVIFRHKEHIERYGLRCSSCHYRDTCSNCHNGTTHPARPPIKSARTWKESHVPCVGCHEDQRCAHCHYKDGQSSPAVFAHASTGQTLDQDHVKLQCGQCHATLRRKEGLSCGGAECHKDKTIMFPARRPGRFVALATAPVIVLPATHPSVQRFMEPIALPATQPTTEAAPGGGRGP